LRAAHLQPLPEDFRAIAHRLGLSFVTCGYGQTEAGAVCAAAIEIDRVGTGEDLREWRRAYCTRLEVLGVPLRHEKDEIPAGFMGAPSPLLEVSIVGPDGTKALPGAVGELQVRQRSPGLVMTGYLGQTSAVSSDDPLSSNDRVRDLGDGTFAFVERANGVMRVRGENVSGAEVERVILGFEGVLLAHVLGVPAREGHEEEVVALVVMKDGPSPPISDLQRRCLQMLPKYMQPSAIWRVGDLPLTTTGKIDRAAARQIALGFALPDLPTRIVPEIKS
jgi:crotonobetaine/carnitine-CoA ligase